jgi:hypothetical protein
MLKPARYVTGKKGPYGGKTIFDFSRMDPEIVRAHPLPKTPRPTYLLGVRQERVAVLAFQKLGSIDALDYLADHHRPMVARMAERLWRRNGNVSSKAALIEYGMLGVRRAAECRPSQTKNGATVGFSTGSGFRFNTYARTYADKEMRIALAELDPPEDLEASVIEFREWAATPIPDAIEQAAMERLRLCEPPEPKVIGPLELPVVRGRDRAAEQFVLEYLHYHHDGISHLRRRRDQIKCSPVDWVWRSQEPDAVFFIAATNFGWLVGWLEYEEPRPIEIRRKTRMTQRERGLMASYLLDWLDKLRWAIATIRGW